MSDKVLVPELEEFLLFLIRSLWNTEPYLLPCNTSNSYPRKYYFLAVFKMELGNLFPNNFPGMTILTNLTLSNLTLVASLL
jgi:hypothetical protein